MTSDPNTHLRFWLMAAAVVIVLAGLRAAEAILAPFLLSIFITILCVPFLLWLKEKGWHSGLALLIVLGSLLFFGGGFLFSIEKTIEAFLRDLPNHQATLQQRFQYLNDMLIKMEVLQAGTQLTDLLSPHHLFAVLGDGLRHLGVIFSDAFLIFLCTLFMLLEVNSFSTKLRAMSNNPDQHLGSLRQIVHDIKRYMVMKTWMSLATGTAVALWLWFLGIDHPWLWGLVVFLLNYLPNIGSLISSLLILLIAYAQAGVWIALYALLGKLLINTLIGTILEPKIMGRGLGLSTLVVFISLVFWGWLLGPVGILLSVPLTISVKIVLANSPQTCWLSILLGSEDEALARISSKQDKA